MGDKTNTRYRLTGITETHLRAIMKALDFTARVGMGQFRELFDLVDSTFKVRGPSRDEAEKLLFRARSIMMPDVPAGGYLGIRSQELPDHHRIGFDVHQVIRHRLAWDRNPKGDFMVDFDEPWRTSTTVDLIGIEREDEATEEASEQLPPPPTEIILDAAPEVPAEKPVKKSAPKKSAPKKSVKPVEPSKAEPVKVESPKEEPPRKATAERRKMSLRSAMQTPLCSEKIACDGSPLYKGRTMCGKCEEALAKRAKSKAKETTLKGVPSRTNKKRT